jgi:hypothetical protein
MLRANSCEVTCRLDANSHTHNGELAGHHARFRDITDMDELGNASGEELDRFRNHIHFQRTLHVDGHIDRQFPVFLVLDTFKRLVQLTTVMNTLY